MFGDEQRVLQVARALVENALVHTPSGTRVEVRTSEGALEVEDDGPGIPAAHAEHVFERFYRVEGQRASGSGAGLASRGAPGGNGWLARPRERRGERCSGYAGGAEMVAPVEEHVSA